MTIFIDDLDRCQPKNVVEILEAVNFLVSSGGCYVVAGMSRSQVEAAVGLSFAEIAKELATTASHDDCRTDAASDARQRAEYADLYLRKLINIEVPIPRMTQEAGRDILAGEQREHPALFRAKRPVQLWKFAALAMKARKAVPVLVSLFFVCSAAWLGVSLPGPPSTPEAEPRAAIGFVASPPGVSSPQEAVEHQGNEGAPGPGPTEFFYVPEPDTRVGSVVLWVSLCGFLAAFAFVLTRRRDLIEDDSVRFKGALNAWGAIIACQEKTPREVKRFLNRLRFVAMRQRTATRERTLWRQLETAVRINAGLEPVEPQHRDRETIPEDVLVALGAIERLDERLVQSDATLPSPEQAENRWPELRKVQQEMPGAYNPQDILRYRAVYRQLARGLHVN
jgi:hypothetical protein